VPSCITIVTAIKPARLSKGFSLNSHGEIEKKVREAGLQILRSTSFVTILLPAMMLSRKMQKNKYNDSIFKIQLAFYRNYSSGMKILEHSDWSGP
jgi:hypothetical protein